MWRPKNWDTSEVRANNEHCFGAEDVDCWIEAGADAMLACLLEMASESPTGTFTIDSHIQHIYGRLEMTREEAKQAYEEAIKVLDEADVVLDEATRKWDKAYQIYIKTQEAYIEAKPALEEAK